MSPTDIAKTLRLHGAWCRGEPGGVRANLSDANLRGADLTGADLTGADLTRANLNCANLNCANLNCANLSDANLRGADLTGANLNCANLSGADLGGANLNCANLNCANLGGANLSGADLGGANLNCANLGGANLSGADLRGADLTGADLTRAKLPAFQICPEQGQFHAWKRVSSGVVLELLISGNRTSSLVGRKCRASKAKVLRAYGPDGAELTACEWHSASVPSGVAPLTYRLGRWVHVRDYNPDPRVECSRGVHFFVTRSEAEEYQ